MRFVHAATFVLTGPLFSGGASAKTHFADNGTFDPIYSGGK
jgi:hypothetical protein